MRTAYILINQGLSSCRVSDIQILVGGMENANPSENNMMTYMELSRFVLSLIFVQSPYLINKQYLGYWSGARFGSELAPLLPYTQPPHNIL